MGAACSAESAGTVNDSYHHPQRLQTAAEISSPNDNQKVSNRKSPITAVSEASTLSIPDHARQIPQSDNPQAFSPEPTPDIFHLTNVNVTPETSTTAQPKSAAPKTVTDVNKTENNKTKTDTKPMSTGDNGLPWRQALYKVADMNLWGEEKREDRQKWRAYLDKAEQLVKKPRKDLPQDVVSRVLDGDTSDLDLASIPSAQPRMIVFVSSTFTDTKAERNNLMRDVYPFLRTLCRNLGVDFGTVDMRWGVTEDATLDHSTVSMCVREIKRCVDSSAGPAFLCILGQKYGYRPLPAEIEQVEFETMTSFLEREGLDSSLVKSFYRLDTNAVPPEYVLKPQPKGDNSWWDDVSSIQEALRTAAVACFGKCDKTDKYHISVTETEIVNGAFTNKKCNEQVLFMERDLENLTAKEHLDRKLIDMKGAEIDDYAQQMLDSLRKEKVSGYTTEGIVLQFDYTSSTLAQCEQHIRDTCDNVCERLAIKILEGYEKNLHMKSDQTFREVLQHRQILVEKCSLFVGREAQIKRITAYTDSKEHDKQPLVVHGESGCGKTALLAMAAKKTKSSSPNSVLVVRFLGTTTQSGSARALLSSVCTQITRAYDKKVSDIPQSYKELIVHFRTCLGYAEQGKPLIIFLDSLDQLSTEDFAHNLAWLSLGEELPEHVKLVVSTLPTKCLQILTSFIPEEDMIEIQRLKTEEGPDILDKMLEQKDRTLSPEQKAIVLEKFSGCSLPLYLRLAADIAMTWHSYDDVKTDAIADDIKGLVTLLFERLETRFGAMFVHHALSYITAAKYGLSVAELEDILSCDDTVLDSIFEWWIPPFRRIPQLLWARVRGELGGYLVERGAEGVNAYNWYHRQFWQTAEERYLYKPFGNNKDTFDNEAHEAIADYFEGRWATGKMYAPKAEGKEPKLEDRKVPKQPLVLRGVRGREPGRQLNGRKLSEMPYHLIQLKDWSRFLTLVKDLGYIEAKFENDNGYDCLSELITATRESGNPEIQMLTRFVGSNLSFLLHEPLAVYQVASQQADSHPVRQLVNEMKEVDLPLPLLKNMSNESYEDPCEMTLQGHTETIRCCDYSPKGELIVSTGDDGSMRVWDAITGAELVTITSLPLPVWPKKEEGTTLMLHPVNPCCFSRSGDVIANGTEHGDVMLWDTSGALILTKSTVDNPVTFVQFSIDDTILATSFKNGNVMIWDAATLDHMTTVRVGAETTGLSFSPDGKFMAVASFKGLAVVDTSTYSIRGIGRSQASLILCCTVHPSGKQIMTGGDDSCVGVWDPSSAQQIDQLRRHKAWIWSIKFTKDGKNMFTCSSDRSMKVWHFSGSWEVTATIGGHSHRVSMVSIKPGSEDKLVTSSLDRSLKLWDMAAILDGKVPPVGGLHYNVCAYSPSGYLVTSQGWQKTCSVSNLMTEEDYGTTPTHNGFIIKAEFVQDGTKLVVLDTGHGGDYGTDAATRASVKVVTVPEIETLSDDIGVHAPTCISCHSDVIVVGTLGGDVCLYDTVTLQERDNWSWARNIHAISISMVGNCVAACSESTCRVWDMGSGHRVLADLEHDSKIYVCVFSPDNSFLATGVDSGKIYIWNSMDASFSPRLTLSLHTAYIKDIKFSPKGNYMLSCGDLSLRVWDVQDNLALKCAYYGPVNCAAFKAETIVLAGEASGLLKCLVFKEHYEHDRNLTPFKIKQNKSDHMRSRAKIRPNYD